VITAFGGSPVADSNALVAAIATHKPGDVVDVTVRRGSGTAHVKVTLGAQPAQSPSSAG
jgi:S1-C subfamily serine protease